MAIAHPQRVRTLTSMLSSSNHLGPPLPRPKTLILFKATPTDRAGAIERAVKVRQALTGGVYPLDEKVIRRQAGRSYERNHTPGAASRHLAAIMASAACLRDGLASVTAPTLVIHGRADPLLPVKHGIRTAETIPRAQLRVIEGLGHEFPEAVWPQVIEAIAAHAI
jgi:pimeloyl-ACP methyl ester carboxylesterase